MSSETLQTISQIIVAVGLLMAAGGGFGAYYFGQRVQAQKEAREAYAGRLRSPSKVLLSGRKALFPKLEFGDSGAIFAYAGPQGSPLFSIAEDNDITIEMEDGRILVSASIRDKSGALVAEMVRNEWKVIADRAWDRNYSSDALEVRRSSGDIVLQVKLVGDRVQFQAKLYDKTGLGIAFGKVRGPQRWGGGIEFTGSEHPNLELKIAPIFKYPSALHLGERVNNRNAG